MLEKKEVENAVPVHLRSQVTDELVAKLNAISSDPEVAEHIRSNFLSYTNVANEGRFTVEGYLNAVAYVSYKLMGYNNEESYARTFPQRYASLRAAGRTTKEISSYVSAYNKGKLVNLIFEQTVIPSYVLNQSIYQDAIEKQAELMQTARSEMVRTQAANSLLTHLKPPEKKEVDINIGIQETSGMVELREMLTTLAESQQSAIEQGIPTREIAHQPLTKKVEVIDAEFTEADPEG